MEIAGWTLSTIASHVKLLGLKSPQGRCVKAQGNVLGSNS